MSSVGHGDRGEASRFTRSELNRRHTYLTGYIYNIY